MSSEEELIASINAYEEQLGQINAMLDLSPDDEEMLSLKSDLENLISLTKDSLLDVKKQNLLKELDKYEQNPQSSMFSINIDKLPNNTTADTKLDSDIEINEMIGKKYRVYYECPATHIKCHNAIVMSVDIDSEKVKVIFCNPTQNSLKFCDYFLEDNCKFNENCKFSHGYEIDADKIEPYVEPDLNDIKIGKTCLAKYTDGLWYLAQIESIDENEICVQFKGFNKTLAVTWEDVTLIDDYGDESDEILDQSIDHNEDTDEFINTSFNPRSLEPKPHGIGKLGDWEKYTRGIGSKLLSKMGYQPGKGLGSKGEGRTEPIDVYVLPAGKSLDKIMELKEKKLLRKQKFQAKEEKPKSTNESSIFEFINKSLCKTENPNSSNKCDLAIENEVAVDSKIKNAPSKNLNIEMLNVHNEIQNIERNISKIKQSIERNKKADKATIENLKQKLQQNINSLSQLRKNESKIQNERSNRKGKLDIF